MVATPKGGSRLWLDQTFDDEGRPISRSLVTFWSVAIDASDNVVVAGSIHGTGTYSFGGTASATGGFTGDNLVIVKFDPSGSGLWATTATTATASSVFNSVAINRSTGSIYAAGWLGAGGTFVVPQYLTSLAAPAGGGAVWLRFDPSGSASGAWGGVMTGSGASSFNGITIDSAGNLFAAGQIGGTGTYTFNNSGSVATNGTATNTNLLLVRFDLYGGPLWARSVTSGTSSSSLSSVAVDTSGNVYVSGSITGTGTFGLGNGTTVAGTSSSNAVLVQYDLSGNAHWAQTPKPGPSTSVFNSVTCDSAGKVYAAGQMNSTATYTYGTGVSVAGTGTYYNPILVKYDSTGSALWAKSSISGSDSFFSAVAMGPEGEVYAAGELYGNVAFSSGVSVTGSAGTGTGSLALVRYVP